MITALIAIAALGQTAQANSAPAALVSKMLARYNNLNTLTGKLHFDQTAQGNTISGETEIQYQRPSLLYIRQNLGGPEPAAARIVSDGKRFLYSIPQDTKSSIYAMGTDAQVGAELVESVIQAGVDKATTLDLGQIYEIGCGGLPVHPAPPLDIAINRRPDLQRFVGQLATVEDRGDGTVNGHAAHLIGGDWREYPDAPVSGKYVLAIDNDGDLLQYITSETFLDPRVKGMQPTQIVTTWTVDLAVNGPVNKGLFSDPALKTR